MYPTISDMAHEIPSHCYYNSTIVFGVIQCRNTLHLVSLYCSGKVTGNSGELGGDGGGDGVTGGKGDCLHVTSKTYNITTEYMYVIEGV